MARVPLLGKAEVKEGHARLCQKLGNLRATILMLSMGAPGGDDGLGPGRALKYDGIIVRADGVFRATHRLWICFTPGEDVGDGKTSIPKRTGAPFAAFDGWVVLHFRGF